MSLANINSNILVRIEDSYFLCKLYNLPNKHDNSKYCIQMNGGKLNKKIQKIYIIALSFDAVYLNFKVIIFSEIMLINYFQIY